MATEQDILAKLRALSNQSSSTPQQSLRPTLPGRTSMVNTSLSQRLPAPTQQRFSPEVGRAQAKLSNYTRNSASEFPSLSERLKLIKGGQTEQSTGLGGIGGAILNNPITKTALGALSIIDTPRRAVISGLREGMDLLDSDPNTKASFGDLLNQTADTSYGFGTAFPMKGALGRVVGFLGDVAFDPLTYATLGSTVAKKAVVKGALDASGKPMLLREALGVKNVAGREGAVALSGLAERMGASPRLIQAIARDGKRAFRRLDAGYADEGIKLAERMGLQKNGIYYLGSRIKVPFSGVIADGIESGLVGARLGVLKHVPGATRFQELITPRGTSSTKELKVARAALRRGEGTAERASMLVRSEAMHFAERANANIASDVYAKGVKVLMEDNDVINAGADIYKFLDSPESAWTRPMTPGEKLAYDKYKPFWENLHKDVEDAIKQVEPNFVLGKQDNFFPHVRTEAAERLAEDVSARGEQIRQYLKYDPTDPAGSFRSRQLKKGSEWFGHKLTQEDVDKGVDQLNYLAKNPKVVDGVPVAEAMTENFFETDVLSVLKKYGDHYSSQIGLAYALRKGVELDVMRQGKIAAEFTDTFIDAVDTAVVKSKAKVVDTSEDVRLVAQEAIVATQNELQRLQDNIIKELDKANVLDSTIPFVETSVEGLRVGVTKLIEARSAHAQAVKAFGDMFDEQNIIVDNILASANSVDKQLESTIKTIQDLMSGIVSKTEQGGTIVFEGKERTIASTLRMLKNRTERLATEMNKFDAQFKHIDEMADTVELIMGSNLQGGTLTGDNLFDRILSITDREQGLTGAPGTRSTASGRGGLGATFMTNLFKDVEKFPEFKAIREVIDPTGKNKLMTPRALSKMFLEDTVDKEGNVLVRGVKNRIYSALTLGQNQEELRQAALWLIARDYKIASTTGTGRELLLDAATRARHDNLIALLEESDIAERIAYARAANTGKDVRTVGPGGKPLTKSEELKSKMYNTVAQYQSIKDELDNNVKALENIYDGISDGAVLRSREQAIVKDLEEKIARNKIDLQKAGKQIPPAQKNIADRLGQTNGLVEQNLRLANAVSEYYIHRETSVQVARIAEMLSFTGIDATPELYKTILGRVSNDELVGLRKFSNRFEDAENVVRSIAKNLEGSSNKSYDFKEELAKLFQEIEPPKAGANAAELEAHRIATNNQELMREFFPEMEKIWGESRSERSTRQFYKDSRAIKLIEELSEVAKDLGVQPETIRGIQRSAHPVRTPSGPRFTRDGVPIDYSEGKQSGGLSSTVAFQESQIDAVQGNVQKLINMVEALEDARVSGGPVKAAKESAERIAANERAKIKEEYDFAVQAIEDQFDPQRTQVLSGPGQPKVVLDPESAAERKRFLQLAELEYKKKLRAQKQDFQIQQQNAEVETLLNDTLSQPIGELLPDGMQLKPVTKAELRSPKVKELRERYNAIMADIAKNQAAQKAAGQRLAASQARSGSKVVGKEFSGAAPGQRFGFTTLFADALSGGDRRIDDLFAELLGGGKTVYNSEFTETRIIGTSRSPQKLVQGIRGTRTSKIIPYEKSYFGGTKARLSKRMSNLGLLSSDATISAQSLIDGIPGSYKPGGEWNPGQWAYNPDLHGASGLADSLDEAAVNLVRKADEIEARSARTASLVKAKASEQTQLDRVLPNTPAVELAVRRANIRAAAKAAKRRIEPAINRLRKLQSQPMQARAIQHEAEQKFALELAKISDDYAVRSGLFTPLEWLALWNDGVYKIKPSEEYLFGDVRGYLTNMIDVLRQKRAVTFRQGRPVKGIDNRIASFQRALELGEFNLDEFKGVAYAKFEKHFKEFGDKPSQYFRDNWKTVDTVKNTGNADVVREHRAYGYLAGDNVASIRTRLVSDRFDASPEAAHLRAVQSQKEDISDAMVQQMLRQPDSVSMDKVIAGYKNQKPVNKTLESFKPIDERISSRTIKEKPTNEFVVDVEERVRLGLGSAEPRPKYVSEEARGIYREAEKLRAQSRRVRQDRIAELEETIGRSDIRQMEASAEMAKISKDLEELLGLAGAKPKANQTPLQLAARAERIAADLRPMASAYEGIDSVVESTIRKKVIAELGFEPGQFAGRTEQEIKNFLKNNKRVQKLIRQKQATANRSSLESLFETRMNQEVASFRETLPAPGASNFVVNPAKREGVLAMRSAERKVSEQKMQELRDAIIRLEWTGNYNELTEFDDLSNLFIKQGLDIQTNISKDLALQQIRLGVELVKEQNKLFNLKGSAKLRNAGNMVAKSEQALIDAEESFSSALLYDSWGPDQIARLQLNVEQLKQLIEYGDLVGKGFNKKSSVKGFAKNYIDPEWMQEYDAFIEESRYTINQLNRKEFNINSPDLRSSTSPINSVQKQYLNAKKQYLDATLNMNIAQQDALLADWLKGLTPQQLQGMPGVPFAPSAVQMTVTFDEGFVQLSKFYPNIGVRKEVADIFQNVHRVGDPVIAEQLQKYIGRYTRFFKAYATLSPGFHVRNAISNAFMLFAAGGNPAQMAKGLDLSRRWIEASKNNINVDDWIKSLPEAEQLIARGTIEAAAASGGGQINDFLSEVTPFGTKFMKEKGRWIEQHSRFVLAYDGVASGMTPQQASARVKRYLIDYQDISSLDSVMRQIVPFWMWTSRNFPMQLQNMWTKPRSYQIFNSLKRNMSDDEEGDIVPDWMVKAGAFKLPFGTDLYATPDIGFNRLGQQLEEFVTPSKYMANVNPLIRVPLELMADKQYFGGKQFSKNPVEVSGGSSEFLQPLLQMLGYGQTTPEGKNFVSDKAYYALTSLLPTLSQAERLIPSKTSATGGVPYNALLGLIGVPVKQNTESYMLGELARRKSSAQAEVSKERALKGD
jgi:hypothetical protein